MENLIVQDIEQDLGVCVVEPHGDLIQAVLARVPDRREQDVIYLDLADYQAPFGLNLLACADPTNPIEVQRAVDQVMHIFAKLFGVSHETPLILEYLQNCTQTLIAHPGYTMADIPLLLTDQVCRRHLVASLTDRDVQRFWQLHEQKSPQKQAEDMASTLRRVGEFLQPLSRAIVGQAKTSINFRQVMDERKIVLVKLDPRLEMVTSLIGSVLIAFFLNAAYSRAELPVSKRRQFHLYFDEVRRFATDDFSTLLTEARKFGIGTTIAHQFRDQLDTANQGATLTAANLIVFRVSGQDSEELAKQFDATPPPPAIIGQRPILTPVQDVIGHLVRQGHQSPAVSQFVSDYLVRLAALLRDARSALAEGTGVGYFSSEHVQEGARLLNQVLSQCMRTGKG